MQPQRVDAAGLADGRTYIGDIGLEPEESLEFTAGVDWSPGQFKLTPELFYREVDGFIQGVPSSNETANRFAMMMGGAPPLQYARIAEEQGKGATFASAAALAAIAGAAAGGAAMLTRNLGMSHKAEELEKTQDKAGKNKAEV